MSLRELYEAVLIELRKENAPNLLLEDFNYFANKTIYQYINKRYNIYDINLQTTDDLRVLKSSAFLKVNHTPYKNYLQLSDLLNDLDFDFMGATYTAELPDDYFHLLNCICFYKVNNTYKCYNKGDTWRAKATRLTADSWGEVVDNYWNRPTYKRPYYYIHNVNKNTDIPTNPINNNRWGTDKINNNKVRALKRVSNITGDKILLKIGTLSDRDSILKIGNIGDVGYFYDLENNQMYEAVLLPTGIPIKWREYNEFNTYFIYPFEGISYKYSLEDLRQNATLDEKLYKNLSEDADPFKIVDINGFLNTGDKIVPLKSAQVRYGNASKPLIEIRYGEDNSVFTLFAIAIDYIKAPQHLRLTQEQIDLTLDTSLILEFPDYVCLEIINELVHIIQENIGDPRLLTHPIVSLSIANPAQQLTPDAALTA